MSDYTKNCLRKMWLYRVIDWILIIGPIFTYVCIGLADGGIATWAKVTMIGCCAAALIVIIVNTILQKRLRCPMWLVLIGLVAAIKNYLLPLIIILSLVTILDDLVLTPLIENYRDKYRASKVQDEREEEQNHDGSN